MKVTLLAHTKFADHDYDGNLFPVVEDVPWRPEYESINNPDQLAEFAGRACYQSWGRPNPETATNEGYLANILKQQHESVLEHASATFYIEGIGRATTHELIRHRHLSYSQLSQRFVDESKAEVVVPPAIEALEQPARDYAKQHFYNATDRAVVEYQYLAKKLQKEGATRKQAREAARAVLPNATETKIVVTGNMRAWRDVLRKRFHVAADAEIRSLAGELLKQLRGIAPNSFQDIPDEPYGSE